MTNDLLSLLTSKYKTNVYAADEVPPVEFVSTGVANLDAALGGGLARGRIVEIFGPESTGKSTICLTIAKAAVDRGELVLYIDLEKTLDQPAIERHGLMGNQFIVTRPTYGEMAIDQAVDAIKNGAKLVILDTVAMLMPKSVYEKMEGDSEGRDFSSTAGLLNRLKNKITDNIEFNGAVFIFINQVRDNIGSQFGGISTPGGHAIKHMYSQRIRITHASPHKTLEGHIVSHLKIVKNKCGTPNRECDVPILNGQVQWVEALLNQSEKVGAIKRSGAWYYLVPADADVEPIKLGQGSIKAGEVIEANPEYLDYLKQRCMEAG